MIQRVDKILFVDLGRLTIRLGVMPERSHD
jgi:hypothetical protein